MDGRGKLLKDIAYLGGEHCDLAEGESLRVSLSAMDKTDISQGLGRALKRVEYQRRSIGGKLFISRSGRAASGPRASAGYLLIRETGGLEERCYDE